MRETWTGREAAVEGLWRAHADELVRYATLLVGPTAANDVVSSAFLKVVDRLAGVDNARPYLFRVVSSTAFDQHRSTRRRQARDLHALLPVAATDVSGDVDVRRAVAALSVQQRAVVYFTYWHDHNPDQISGLLDIAPATVRRHLARARVHLRKALS
jgi:RNA polymerase sigma-70 factor (ECF subfamily)